MTKTKKTILIAIILTITCCATSVCSILLYSNFAPTPQERSIIAIVGEENVDNVESCTYKYNTTSFNKDGTSSEIESARINTTWD